MHGNGQYDGCPWEWIQIVHNTKGTKSKKGTKSSGYDTSKYEKSTKGKKSPTYEKTGIQA